MDSIYARGYIASGSFRGNRIPQHIQNQIIRNYCEVNGMNYVLSRAEYWFENKTSFSQLWAALNEGNTDVVFYSIWQLPDDKDLRRKILKHCIHNSINLHFACERIQANKEEDISEIELLNNLDSSLREHDMDYLESLIGII